MKQEAFGKGKKKISQKTSANQNKQFGSNTFKCFAKRFKANVCVVFFFFSSLTRSHWKKRKKEDIALHSRQTLHNCCHDTSAGNNSRLFRSIVPKEP